MLGILIILTGLWAEYRNRVGFRSGVSVGMETTLWTLKEKDIIDIDSKGKILPKFKQEILDVR
jgi:hypothetical protein